MKSTYSIHYQPKHKCWTVKINEIETTRILYNSALSQIPMSMLTNNGIFFTASSVQSLDVFLETKLTNDQLLHTTTNMIISLVSQLKYLYETNNLIVYGFDLKDIIVIDSSIFLFANPYTLLLTLNTIMFKTPFYKPLFCCP